MTTTTFFIIFVPILAILLLAVNLILAPHNPYQEKDSAFECGFHSFLGQNRKEFHITFFIFGMVFLIFDLEIVLIFPYSVSAYHNDIYGLIIMIIFFVLLTLGFIFELGKNALTIYSKQTSSYDNKSLDENHTYVLQKNVIHNKLPSLQSSIIPIGSYTLRDLNTAIHSLTGQITNLNTTINKLFGHIAKLAELKKSKV
jgi:NADH-ubiquinone oxidoreductase chain 3